MSQVILLSNRIYLPSFENFKARVLEFEFKLPFPKVKFSQCLEWKNEWNHPVRLRFIFFLLLKKVTNVGITLFLIIKSQLY